MSITITSTNKIKLNSGACLNSDVTDAELGVRALVGYHNYFRMGVSDATDIVQQTCDQAGLNFVAGCSVFGQMPAGAIRVGQVRVHHGDNSYPLYVKKRDK